MSSQSYDNIAAEIQALEDKKKLILDSIQEQEEHIVDIDIKVKTLIKKFPCCYSCGKRFHPKQMTIATQDDVDEYVDKNEGYCGPEVGEYYCGWC